MNFWGEFRRRHIFRIAAVYAATGWLVLQLGAIVFPALRAPDWALPVLIGFVALGFPVALVLAWAFELTPDGVRRTRAAEELSTPVLETRRRVARALNATIIVVLAAAVGVLAWRLTSEHGTQSRNAALAAAGTANTAATAAAATAAPANSIVVLPFLNLSPKAEMEYFAEGISEQLLDGIAQETNLKVVARTSALQFKNRPADIREIGKVLDVHYVLDGSVRRDGNQIRISVQLINAYTGYQKWSHTYQRTVGDVFRIQDEITRAVATTLKAEIASSSVVARANPPTNTAAYDEYLLGQQLVNRRETESLRAALAHFKKATELDPQYGPAYAQAAIVYTLLSDTAYGNYNAEEVVKLGRPFLERAVALAPEAPDTLAAQGLYLKLTAGPEAALPYFERAVQANPSYMDALNWKIDALKILGRSNEAWSAEVDAVRRDPLNWVININYMEDLLQQRQFDKARVIAERFLAIDDVQGHLMLGDIAISEGDAAEAMRQYLAAMALRPDARVPMGQATILMALAGLGEDAYRFWVTHGGPPQGGLTAALTGHPKTALEQMRTMLRREGDQPAANVNAGEIAIMVGRPAEAKAYFDRAWQLEQEGAAGSVYDFSPDDLIFYGALLLQAGESEKGKALLERVRSDAAKSEAAQTASGKPPNNFDAFRLASVEILTGDLDRGLAGLARVAERVQPNEWLVYFMLVPEFMERVPRFDGVRDDPRFQAIVDGAKKRQAKLRSEILPVLCNWNFSDSDWQPRPATCKGVVKAPAAVSS